MGRLFPISEGTFKAFSIVTDPLDSEIMTAEGEVNVMGLIRDLAQGRVKPRVADIRFCYDGCIGGPGKNRELTGFYKRNLVISHFKKRRPVPYPACSIRRKRPASPSLRSFSNKFVKLDIPKGSDVTRILRGNQQIHAER